jgi:lipid A 3-O-deacylase
MKAFFIALLVLSPAIIKAQAINNQLSYRDIHKDSYFRFSYENDYFTATDNNYTQGIYLEVVSPSLRKFPLSYLLLHPAATRRQYGIAIEHNGYTPNSIEGDSIKHGQRPYAAVLFLKTFNMATDSRKRNRFSSSLSTGIIGPAALGYEMQAGIHEWINGIHPEGWEYQVKNDLVLNYEASIEKSLLSVPQYFLLSGYLGGRIGTLSDRVVAGACIMTGYFQSPYQDQAANGKLQAYLYAQPEIDLVGYDATLQGGPLSLNDPYTISKEDISRVVLQARGGVVVKYKNLYLEYQQSILSKEFASGSTHRTGGIELGVSW